MKIVGIVGNNASYSHNRLLIEFMKRQFDQKVDFEVLEIRDIPLFCADDIDQPPQVVLDFSKKVEEADGVVISTPEYDHSIPAALKSVIEWLSSATHPFHEKPVMIVGASLGFLGSVRAQMNLRQILNAPGLGARVLHGTEFLLAQAADKFDSDGNITDDGTVTFLHECFDIFLADIRKQQGVIEEYPDYSNVAIEFRPGTYEVFAQGHNGKLPMSVTFSDHHITDINIDSEGESQGISDPVFEQIPSMIIEGQTLNVDTISGATVTSQGIIDGVSNAVIKAGGDLKVLRGRPKPSVNYDQTPIEETTDVVVVGSGGAGLSAAAKVIQEGKRVIVLEKFPSIGGNTIRTGGPMNAADPSWQQTFPSLHGESATLEEVLKIDEDTIDPEYRDVLTRVKIQIRRYLDDMEDDRDYLFDSSDWHCLQTYLGGKRTDLNGNVIYGDKVLVETLTDNVLESVKWLESIGVEFNKEDVAMPVGANWRRGHIPLENEGYAYIRALSTFIKDQGGQILTDTKVDSLIFKDGAVKGVTATGKGGQSVTIHADSVVLATGGFGANTAMLQKYNTYWTHIDDDIKTSNSPAITGDGIVLGESVGADLVGMGFSQMMPVSDPDTGALFSGLQVPPANFIMVNKEGKRFVNEYGSRDVLTQAAIDQGGLFYLIADDKIKETAYNTNQEKIDQEVEQGILFRADTLADLAKQIGIDGQVLEETIANYNRYVDQEFDPEFGKNVFDKKVLVAPFYATPRKPAVHHTMGGLKIDKETHVIDTNGKIIPGLYAAGEVAGGIHAGNRLGGNALADIFTYGRFAGVNAARGV